MGTHLVACPLFFMFLLLFAACCLAFFLFSISNHSVFSEFLVMGDERASMEVRWSDVRGRPSTVRPSCCERAAWLKTRL